MVSINPYLGMMSLLDADGLNLLEAVVFERRCREWIGAGTLDEAVKLWRPHPTCPDCGFPDACRNGKTPAGRVRWLARNAACSSPRSLEPA